MGTVDFALRLGILVCGGRGLRLEQASVRKSVYMVFGLYVVSVAEVVVGEGVCLGLGTGVGVVVGRVRPWDTVSRVGFREVVKAAF